MTESVFLVTCYDRAGDELTWVYRTRDRADARVEEFKAELGVELGADAEWREEDADHMPRGFVRHTVLVASAATGWLEAHASIKAADLGP